MTPEQRSLRARVAALTRWSKTVDRTSATAPARAGILARLEREIDPDGRLEPAVRAKLVDTARRARMARLALRRAS